MDSKHIINGLGLYFYRVAENSQDAFWIRTPDFSSVLYVNPVFETIWQQDRDTLYSDPEGWLVPIHEDDRPRLLAAWKHYCQAPHIDDAHTLRYRMINKSHQPVDTVDHCYPLFHEGRCVAFVGVTTREQAAAPVAAPAPNTSLLRNALPPGYAMAGTYHQAANLPTPNQHSQPLADAHSSWSGAMAWQETDHQSQNHFLDMMSHELRTPLNAVLGMAQILQQSPLTPEQHDQLDVIIQSGKNLLGSLSSMLDFAQLESNRIDLNPRSTEIRPLLRTALEQVESAANKSTVQFHFSDDERIPDKLIADPKRLKQIVDHLLENAALHTDQGTITLKIGLSKQEGLRYLVNIDVSDTGAGIPPHKLHHIFKRFSQAGSGYQRQHHGIGLGLAVVKELITKMSGTITVSSTVGKGSSFTCTIPFEADPSQQSLSPKPDSTGLGNPLALNVLVVEDNPINQKITQRLLEQAGCRVNIAECGQAAVSSANEQHDLILMDIGLPDIDGFEATTRIRETERVSRDVPIIAMTAHVFDQDKERCFQVGMNEVIAKPILRDELLDLLQRWSPARKRQTIQQETAENTSVIA